MDYDAIWHKNATNIFSWTIQRYLARGVDGLIPCRTFVLLKIVHRIGSKHTNVDALSRNLVAVVKEEYEMQDEIQYYKVLQVDKRFDETF